MEDRAGDAAKLAWFARGDRLTSLASLLAYVVTAFQASSLFSRVWVVQTEMFAADQFAFKVRAVSSLSYSFQARIYYNQGHFDYAYQLFRDVPVMRWDNKEHFADLPTYPHHYHNKNGLAETSSLQGDPRKDLPTVLEQLARFLQGHDGFGQEADS